MARKLVRTWWGEKFIQAIETLTEAGRLSRGRSYAKSDKILSHSIDGGLVKAKIRGSINPYFGVTKEPRYDTEVRIFPIPPKKRAQAIAKLASRASWVSKLLAGEMPDDIDKELASSGFSLLPNKTTEFQTSCSCPDFHNPCKHVAGLCYFIAAQLDRDPMLLFELRGISREELLRELSKSPLGKILADAEDAKELEPPIARSYYTPLERKNVPAEVDPQQFWSGESRLPIAVEETEAMVSAIAIKKAGDYPPFWEENRSFVETMEEFYTRFRATNRKRV